MESQSAGRTIRLESEEAEELTAWARQGGLDNDYTQVGTGRFKARRRVMLSNDLVVAHQFTNRSLVIKGSVSSGYVLFLNPLNRSHRGILDGTPIGADEFGLIRAGPKSIYRTPPRLRMQFVLLRAARLEKLLATTEGQDLHAVGPHASVFSCPAAHHELTRLAKEIQLSSDTPGEEHLGKIWLPELEEHFVTTLTSCLCAEAAESSTRAQRLDHVDQAREFVAAHYDAPLGLETLASACGICARTLEYAFRDVLDITPLTYIKSYRLRKARERLKGAEQCRGEVTQSALQCGFSHMGHFAGDYRRLFGEHPSATLLDNR